MPTRIHPVPLPFRLPLGPGKAAKRLVHAYLIAGETLGLVDTGVAASHATLVKALAELGYTPTDVAWVINTHAHPDHAGGNRRLLDSATPKFACHPRAARWIEDMSLQATERPIYDFHSLVSGSVRVTRMLEDGDEMDFGSLTLRVLFTPGHSPGSISLFCPEEGVLLTGDAIPPTSGLPLYYHLAESRQSLHRLATLDGVQTMYHSHEAQPYTGPAIGKAIQAGLQYLERMEEAVAGARRALPPDAPIEDITRDALRRMGFDPPPVMPLTIATVKAHLT
ncbi:MAG: MBL fold metallo-hydrolase [Caldilineae bacterium]|nr:MAG: MBL fold metallo-hydrolase [Caldilineae bacterium]